MHDCILSDIASVNL